MTLSSFVVKSHIPSQSKSYFIVLVELKSDLLERILDSTSNLTSSPTLALMGATFRVVIGMSMFLESGGKNTTGPFHRISSLLTSQLSLSEILTQNAYSPATLGSEKNA